MVKKPITDEYLLVSEIFIEVHYHELIDSTVEISFLKDPDFGPSKNLVLIKGFKIGFGGKFVSVFRKFFVEVLKVINHKDIYSRKIVGIMSLLGKTIACKLEQYWNSRFGCIDCTKCRHFEGYGNTGCGVFKGGIQN